MKRQRGRLITGYRQMHRANIKSIKGIFNMGKKDIHRITGWSQHQTNQKQGAICYSKDDQDKPLLKAAFSFLSSNSERIFSWEGCLLHKVMVLIQQLQMKAYHLCCSRLGWMFLLVFIFGMICKIPDLIVTVNGILKVNIRLVR